MIEVSADWQERSRKNERRVLRSLAETGQCVAASRMGVHESTVSRMKDGDIERFCNLLAAVGLKVVPTSHKCVNQEEAQALGFLFAKAMKQYDNPIELLWEEDE